MPVSRIINSFRKQNSLLRETKRVVINNKCKNTFYNEYKHSNKSVKSYKRGDTDIVAYNRKNGMLVLYSYY